MTPAASPAPTRPADFPPTRWSLIAALAEHPDRVSVIIELYAESIRRYLCTKFSRDRIADRVDELLQEVAVDLLAKPEVLARARPGDGSRFRYLVMTMALNAARTFRHREERRVHREAAVDPEELARGLESAVAEPDPDDEARADMDRAWAESVLAQALRDIDGWVADGTLEGDAARVLREHLVEGRSVRDIAARCGLSLAACHRRLAKARTLLQSTVIDRLRESCELPEGSDAASAFDVLLQALRRP